MNAIEPLSAADARQMASWPNMDRLGVKLAAIRDGDHISLARMTEAEALHRLYVTAPPLICVLIEGQSEPMWRIPEREADRYRQGWLAFARSLGLIKEAP